MIDGKVWLTFALLETALCLIPGPAVLLTVGTALRRGAAAALAAALGIVAGNTIYFVLSALGLSAVLASSAALFETVKIAGALYLAYLGVRALSTRVADAPADVPSAASGFAGGLVTQLANPKAIVFFVALLPQFVDVHRAAAPQIALLGLTSQTIELVVLALYAAAGGAARRAVGSPALLTWTERAGGAFLIAVAARLVAQRA
ncbi:MAG TPA: LysE family translocator [Candidatus Sulfotelmatobacter sp.]|nr:LysE family translocator [Candidatus Sulfotelmatobacter sp.]